MQEKWRSIIEVFKGRFVNKPPVLSTIVVFFLIFS